MKKGAFFRIVQILALTFVALSCSKEENPVYDSRNFVEVESDTTHPIPEVVWVDGSKAFKFANEKEFQMFAESFANLPEAKQAEYAEMRGVLTSLVSKVECDSLIGGLIRNSNSRIVFEEKYIPLTQRFSKTLLFNDEDKAEVYPQIRIKKPLLAGIANENGKYVIGDKIISVEKYSSFKERLDDPNIQVVELYENTYRNTAYIKTSNRKAIAEFTYEPHDKSVFVKFTAQKYTLFWWDTYTTDIHVEMELTPTVQFHVPQKVVIPIIFTKITLPRGRELYLEGSNGVDKIYTPFDLLADKTHKVFYTVNTSDFKILFGKFNMSNAFGRKPRMTGKMAVWSRDISYEQRGTTDVNIDFGF